MTTTMPDPGLQKEQKNPEANVSDGIMDADDPLTPTQTPPIQILSPPATPGTTKYHSSAITPGSRAVTSASSIREYNPAGDGNGLYPTGSNSLNYLRVRHSHQGLLSSSATNLPQFLGQQRSHTRSHSSFQKILSNTTDFSGQDGTSVRTIDQSASAKPAVTNADKLWTQIDVLDDVRHMSQEVREKGLFFNDRFSEELAAVKQAQNRLLESMYNQHYAKVTISDHQKNLYKYPDSAGDQSEKQQMIDNFFDDLKQVGADTVYRQKNFDEMHKYIEEIKSGLAVVGELMKEFDENVGSSW